MKKVESFTVNVPEEVLDSCTKLIKHLTTMSLSEASDWFDRFCTADGSDHGEQKEIVKMLLVDANIGLKKAKQTRRLKTV
jgi:hypothetical protein